MRVLPVLFWILLKGYFHGLAALELTGPRAVSGLGGRSVSVPCQYHEGYQETPKYWCSGIIWQSCSKVVETTGSEAEVKWDRASIKDNHTLRTFTVTIENLTLGDTGIYWCGINLRSKSDFNSPVSVTVLQAAPRPPSPASAVTNSFPCIPQTPPTHSYPPPGSSRYPLHSTPAPSHTTDPVLHILTPCIPLVLLLILLTAVLFRRMSQRRHKALEGAPGQRDKNLHPYRLVPGNTPSSFVTSEPAASCKAAICMTMEETPDSADDEAVYEHAIHETQASRSTAEVVPGTVKFPTSLQQTTYPKMNPNTRSRTSPSRPQGKRGKKDTG
ncbi:unnamed protein product [Caretta caretta]